MARLGFSDEELGDLTAWTPEYANASALLDGLILTPKHWQIIDFIREYYKEYQVSPTLRVLIKGVGEKLGKDKGNSRYLYALFPYGPREQARKYAGAPKPTGMI